MVDHLHDFHAHTFSNLPSVDSHALNLLPDQAHFDGSSMAHGEWPGDGQHLWDAQHSAVPGGLPSHGHELSGVTAADHHTGGAMHTPADAGHHPDGTHAHMGGAGEVTGHAAVAPRFGYAPREVNGEILSCTETSPWRPPGSHHVSHPAGHTHHGHPGVAARFGSSGTRDWEGMHGNVYRSHDGGWTWNKIN